MNQFVRNVLEQINKTKINREKDYKTPIKEILSISSLQFLLKPISSKRLLIKIINIIFLMLSLCLSIYLVISSIIEFLKYDTNTSIRTITEKDPKFPVVSFCPTGDLNYVSIAELWFNNEYFNSNSSEWADHFEIFHDSSFSGGCYRFNSGMNMKNEKLLIKKSKRSGYDNGFYIGFKSDSKSFYVSIHNQTINHSTIYDKGHYISVGSRNYFIVKRFYDIKLEYPYNECLKEVSNFNRNKTIIDFLKKKNSDYSLKECIRLCVNLKYIEKNPCHCSLNSIDDDISRKCDGVFIRNDELQKCFRSFVATINDNEDNCLEEYCPLECDTFGYDISINSHFDEEYLSSNKTVISVYYEDLRYTLISQNPKFDFVDLISSIGGSLGLFLGISFISFVELFEVLSEFMFIYFGY